MRLVKELIKMLNRKIAPEVRKAWVSQAIESLSKEQLDELYDRPDQEFSSQAEEENSWAEKLL